MGYDPERLKWYVADLVVQITVECDPRSVIHTNIFLLRARSPEEAYRKAMELGSGSETSYENPDGKLVTFRFRGLRNLHETVEDPEDGAEINYREDVGWDEAAIRKWVTAKEDLGVFQSPLRTNRPDYRSKEVMDRLYEPLPDLDHDKLRDKMKKGRPCGPPKSFIN